MVMKIFGITFGSRKDAPITATADSGPVQVDVDELEAYMSWAGGGSSAVWQDFTGDKFEGGFGPAKIPYIDYWALRAKSNQLFTENLYARGIIRRLVTNEINTGLFLECIPDESILGLDDDTLGDWAEDVETRFTLWGNDPEMCDFRDQLTWGEIEEAARLESLIGGDVLIMLRTSQKFKTINVQLVPGEQVQTPTLTTVKITEGHKIVDGVEIDTRGRQVAYWMQQAGTLESKRLAARGPKSGRRMAWLIYGTDKRYNSVRGQPLLSIVLQSLKEIDRYRDSAQRKAVINSILAMFIKKNSDKMGTNPLSGTAVRAGQATVEDGGKVSPRQYNVASQIPGLVLETLQEGEEPVGFNSAGTDINFPVFEAAVLSGIAWAMEMPPEILLLQFGSNYSASQAAINEFKMYLNKVRTNFGRNFCQPIYKEWLLSQALVPGRISFPGPSFLGAFRDASKREILNAWYASDWSGAIKPSTDMLKTYKAYKGLTDEAWLTNDRAARETTGTKFTKNVKTLARENRLKAAAARPLLELEAEFGAPAVASALASVTGATALSDDEPQGLFIDEDGNAFTFEDGHFVDAG